MRYVRAEFTDAIFFHLSIEGLRNGRLKKVVDVASFFFPGLGWCIFNWLDIDIHQKPFVVNILWIS
jgi:hypothetical protein